MAIEDYFGVLTSLCDASGKTVAPTGYPLIPVRS
jgi:hypothetical protein